MSEDTNRRWLLAKRPGRQILEDDFRFADAPVPKPAEGQALVRNLWLSLDPTQILFTSEEMGDLGVPIGGVMRSIAAGRIVESRLRGFKPGDLVQGFFGWEDYSLTDGRGADAEDLPVTVLPPDVPLELSLGPLGITGMAAYFGVLEVAKAQPGETFVVTSAVGGVGSVAGQIAKIHGLRVIGITSGKERCDAVIDELGFDGVIDRKSEDVEARLSSLCPDGIDIFFDNTGGPVLDIALSQLRHLGRVVLCGMTPVYMEPALPPGPKNYSAIIMKRGRIEGLLAREYVDRFPEARKALGGWIQSGKLKPKVDVVVGLENAPRALARVFEQKNIGKQLLKVADS